MLIRIKNNVGFTQNNIPSAVFELISSIDSINDELLISCDINNKGTVCQMLLDYYQEHLAQNAFILNQRYCENDCIIELINRVGPMQQEVHPRIPGVITAREVINGPMYRGNIIHQEMQENIRNVLPPEPLTVRQAAIDIDIDPDVAEPSDGEMIESHLQPVPPCSGDEKILIAGAMKNALGSNINVVKEKILELNRLISKTLVLRNEIEILMKPVEENQKVNFIIDQLKKINEDITENSLIKKVYVNKDGNITILTKRLHTEKLDDDTIRDVGEMQIIINSNAILSETVFNNPTTPIHIYNLTHIFEDDDGVWAGGHIPHQGEPCFGHIFEQLDIALKTKNIMMAIELIIKYIRNPDTHDGWGCKILGFPVVTPETAGTDSF